MKAARELKNYYATLKVVTGIYCDTDSTFLQPRVEDLIALSAAPAGPELEARLHRLVTLTSGMEERLAVRISPVGPPCPQTYVS